MSRRHAWYKSEEIAPYWGKRTFTHRGGKHLGTVGGKTFFVEGGVGEFDVYGHEEEDVSKASKLSLGAGILGVQSVLKF